MAILLSADNLYRQLESIEMSHDHGKGCYELESS